MRTSDFHSTRGFWQRRFVSQANLNFYKNALLRQVMLITDVRALEHQKHANNIVFLSQWSEAFLFKRWKCAGCFGNENEIFCRMEWCFTHKCWCRNKTLSWAILERCLFFHISYTFKVVVFHGETINNFSFFTLLIAVSHRNKMCTWTLLLFFLSGFLDAHSVANNQVRWAHRWNTLFV